jgi:hypothetical protein
VSTLRRNHLKSRLGDHLECCRDELQQAAQVGGLTFAPNLLLAAMFSKNDDR